MARNLGITDLSGSVFGSLTVLREAGSTKRKRIIWACLCECGNEKLISSQFLRGLHPVQSCGCNKRDIVPIVSGIDHVWLVKNYSYDPVTGLLAKRGAQPRSQRTAGYRSIKINGKQYQLHRVVWFYVHGAWPAAYLDHKNITKSETRIEGLREATPSQNTAHQHRKVVSKYGYRGVRKTESGKFFAEIKVNFKQIRGASCATAEDAARDYDRLALTHFGEFAVLNFPERKAA